MAETDRLYLHEGRWNHEPEGAELRMDVSVREQQVAVRAINVVHKPRPEGGWDAVLDVDHLGPVQQGLVWETWRTQRGGDQMLVFRGARAVDDRVLHLLDGLLLRDRQGEPLADPRSAGRTFLLTTEHAREFLQRLKRHDARVFRVELDVPALETRVVQVERHLKDLKDLLVLDRAAVTEARAGDLSAGAAFDRRSAPARAAADAVMGGRRQITDDVDEQVAAGELVDERLVLVALQGRLNSAADQAGALLEERELLTSQVAAWRAFHADRGPRPDRAPAAAQLLYTQMGALLEDQGAQVEVVPGGLRVRSTLGWIRLGPGVTVEAHDR